MSGRREPDSGTTSFACTVERAIEGSISWLASDEADNLLSRNTYWPKWHSPWWHMLLLFEMGRGCDIPARAIKALVAESRRQYLDHFPFRAEEVPPGIDPLMGIPCHCQLGTLYRVLHTWGVDVDDELPWIRPWFLKYQMTDGGLNCDEGAYLREPPVSSIVSTLPPLEAVLHCTSRPFTSEEVRFLDQGAHYLLRHRLLRSERSPERLVNPDWTKVIFPRFYEYDYLRGLTFLTDWSRRLDRKLPSGAIAEAVSLLRSQLDGKTGSPVIGRSWHAAARTRLCDETGDWTGKGPATTFPLLELVRSPGLPVPWLRETVEGILLDTKSVTGDGFKR